jgi:CRP-like cAMP-binding protein
VDAPTTVDYGTRKATMPDGSLFGQWGCVYGTPRSATIVAARPVYVLEMLRNVLDYVLDDKQFQEDNDRDYVENVLRNHLAGLPIFRELTAGQFAELRADVRLRRFRDGEVIFSRGDVADSFYVVRRGVVKVLLDHGRVAGSENVLTYLSQGDFFGEIGVMAKEEEDKKRTATCVAYVHPRPEGDEADPEADKWRRNERVELVEIPGASLRQLCERHKAIKDKVEREIAARKRRSDRRLAAEVTPAQQSDRFQQLGLIQGQKLMLIDLDRCTRCDECVEACVAQHDDGRARLFLDGPRFGKYLVPTTCRACRDPVCLIGCPVGSIRRGDNLQIVIEDWCIGCTLCAKNCPYGSIQMHDVGLLAEESHGWRWRRRDRVNGDSWTRPGFIDHGWDEAHTPVWWDRDRGDFDSPAALCFRLDFALRAAADPEGGYKLVIDTASAEVKVEGAGRSARVAAFPPVWLNGAAVPAEKWKPDRGQFVCELLGEERRWLRVGRNVIAVQLTPVAGKRSVLLQAALDEIRPSGAVIPLKAVVCDQCSELPGREPACVHACPHDAAMRVDAWTRFPG